MKKRILLVLTILITSFTTTFAQFDAKWYLNTSIGRNEVVFDYYSFRFSHVFQTNGLAYTLNAGRIMKPFQNKVALKEMPNKKWKRYFYKNLSNSTVMFGVGVRKVDYAGFNYISRTITDKGRESFNTKENIDAYYTTLNIEYFLPISKVFSLSVAYEPNFITYATRVTDEYQLFESSPPVAGTTYNVINKGVRKDNYRDSLKRVDGFVRIGLTAKASKRVSFTYYRCLDRYANLSNRYHRYHYNIQEVALRYIF